MRRRFLNRRKVGIIVTETGIIIEAMKHMKTNSLPLKRIRAKAKAASEEVTMHPTVKGMATSMEFANMRVKSRPPALHAAL